MVPAFSSTRQAAAFALLLLVVLLLPLVAGRPALPPRAEAYSSLIWRYCAPEYLYRQLFQEKSDIDIAFIGSSRMWAGIDAPYVQRELSKKLGREAVVRTIAWSWLGFDALYFITKDLLENRKVRMIVFDDESREDSLPHAAAPHWFRYADGAAAITGMPLKIRLSYYFASIVGMPRNLLSLLRANIPEVVPSYDDAHWAGFYGSPNVRENLGALSVTRMVDRSTLFVDFVPQGKAQPGDVLTYSVETQGNFRLVGPPITEWQMQFAKELAALSASHGTKLVFLHLNPTDSSHELGNPLIEEHAIWPTILDHDVPMIGVPPSRLYSGLNTDEILKFFYTGDLAHYNRNGQRFFTPIITPALLAIYASQVTH